MKRDRISKKLNVCSSFALIHSISSCLPRPQPSAHLSISQFAHSKCDKICAPCIIVNTNNVQINENMQHLDMDMYEIPPTHTQSTHAPCILCNNNKRTKLRLLKSKSWGEFNHQSLQVKCYITNQIVFVNASLFRFTFSLCHHPFYHPTPPSKHHLLACFYSLIHTALSSTQTSFPDQFRVTASAFSSSMRFFIIHTT